MFCTWGAQHLVPLFLLLSCALLPGQCHLYNNQYSGDKVIRVFPKNEKEANELKNMYQQLQVDLWQPSSIRHIGKDTVTDVHTSGNSSQVLLTYLTKAKIQHKILVNNVQLMLEAQQVFRPRRKRRSLSRYDYNEYHPLHE
ncbi:hypothetical protein XELAEV_180337811mg, partial [Xenopus laevis]